MTKKILIAAAVYFLAKMFLGVLIGFLVPFIFIAHWIVVIIQFILLFMFLGFCIHSIKKERKK